MRAVRVLIVVAALAAAVQLLAAGASAGVRYDALTADGFISRGDVITYVGKQGLVANPVVLAKYRHDWEIDCTREDGTNEILTGSTPGHVMMLPSVRRAANGTITGYVLPGTVVDTYVESPQVLCDGGSPTFSILSHETVYLGLWFNGVQLPT